MILVENPVDAVRRNTMEIAERVLSTDPTNIILSQWQVEDHSEGDMKYVVYCAANRRLDPLENPIMLHVKARDFDHLKMMFHFVEWAA